MNERRYGMKTIGCNQGKKKTCPRCGRCGLVKAQETDLVKYRASREITVFRVNGILLKTCSCRGGEPTIGRADYAERQEEKRERYEARADKARAKAGSLDKQASAAVAGIPMGQPILIGHHSEKRHRSALKRAQDKTFQAIDEHKKSEHYAGKAAGVGTGGISSDDPEAVVKLREKVAKAEKLREAMKKLNRLYRKHRGDWEAIKATGEFSDDLVANAKRSMEANDWRITAAVSYEKKPIPGWKLTNLGAGIRRMKKRIEILLANAQISEAEPVEGDGYRIEEDKADNRIRFYFDEKPSREVCRRMKQSGFRWSPTAGAWQRMLNPRARTMAELMAKELFPQKGGGS